MDKQAAKNSRNPSGNPHRPKPTGPLGRKPVQFTIRPNPRKPYTTGRPMPPPRTEVPPGPRTSLSAKPRTPSAAAPAGPSLRSRIMNFLRRSDPISGSARWRGRAALAVPATSLAIGGLSHALSGDEGPSLSERLSAGRAADEVKPSPGLAAETKPTRSGEGAKPPPGQGPSQGSSSTSFAWGDLPIAVKALLLLGGVGGVGYGLHRLLRGRKDQDKEAAEMFDSATHDRLKAAVAKIAGEKQAQEAQERRRKGFCRFLDKVASHLPLTAEPPLRLLQAGIAAGTPLMTAIKEAYPRLPGEARGIMGDSLMRKAAADMDKNKDDYEHTYGGKTVKVTGPKSSVTECK